MKLLWLLLVAILLLFGTRALTQAPEQAPSPKRFVADTSAAIILVHNFDPKRPVLVYLGIDGVYATEPIGLVPPSFRSLFVISGSQLGPHKIVRVALLFVGEDTPVESEAVERLPGRVNVIMMSAGTPPKNV